jgi:glutamine amidotransferase-like uncharacterized protein
MSISSLSPLKKALVYLDEGCCYHSAKALCNQLKEILDPKEIEVETVDSSYLKKEDWRKNTKVLAFGGGACGQWEKNLGEKGMDNIREYAKEGGSIIGLCAGSYFLSASSYFKLKSTPAIEKERSLPFFSGKAIGPILETDKHLSPEAARAMEVAFTINGIVKKGSIYYQGGCYFSVPKTSSAKVVAACEYDRLPVAVNCSFGKGVDNVFLSGLHPEFTWSSKLRGAGHPALADLAEKLSDQETFRQEVWKEIGTRLKLPLMSTL